MSRISGLDIARVTLKQRRTKIIATLGPASWERKTLHQLVNAGVDIFRLNFSHGDHAGHREAMKRIRIAARKADRYIGVMADLCGPKIRVGKFEGGGIDLVQGETVIVTSRAVKGAPGLIPSQYRRIHEDVKKADLILLDDGNLMLQVDRVRGRDIECTVVHGGRLKDHKGLNLPYSTVSVATLTPKDRKDARFAIGLGVDYLALSFVRSAKCVTSLRRLIAKEGANTAIVAKIEKPQALTCIRDILDVSDAIMVARGDLGVEMPVEEVPLIQGELVRLAIEANTPVIMATQMLESMVENPRPTRAEVTDVATAAQLGADAVMLSAETAVGAYPVAAVKTMNRVVRLIEGHQWKHGQFDKLTDHADLGDAEGGAPLSLPEALSRATSLLSRGLAVRAVVVPTNSGNTARSVSAERPAAPVFCFSDKDDVCRRATLYWGVTPHKVSAKLTRDPPALARWAISKFELATKGQTVLLVWDTSPDRDGSQRGVSVVEV